MVKKTAKEDMLSVIEYVKDFGAKPTQYRYDRNRERIYSLIALKAAEFQPKTIIDVGTAYGTLAVFLSKCGIKVKATDNMELHNTELFKKHNIDFTKSNIELENIPYKGDVALFTDVLEHLCYNPLEAVRRLRKTAPALILTTPARETDYVCEGRYKDEINWRQIPFVNKYNYKFEDKHHHTYCRWELDDLLKEAGYINVSFQYLPMEATWLVVAR